jgi:glucan-binding YG repeat protein
MKKILRRALTVILTLTLLSGTMSLSAFAAEISNDNSAKTYISKGDQIDGTNYYVTSKKDYAIAPDISESVITTNTTEHNSQTVVNVMEVNTSNGNAKVVAGYGKINPSQEGWTLMTTTDQAHLYEKTYGENVVGGINSSWFNINTGEPTGYLVMRGVVHHNRSTRAYMAAFSDGSVNVFDSGTTLEQAAAIQSEQQGYDVTIEEAVDAYTMLVKDGKVYNPGSGNEGAYPRSAIGIKADGTVVLLQADGTMAPRSVGYTAEEEANLLVSLGCVSAIRLDEGGSSTYLSQREGEDDLTMRNTPAGGSERVISGSILIVSTVAASGEFDHVAITPDSEYYTPNSTVDLTATAMDYSGAEANDIPSDISFEIADSEMGTISEITLDSNTAKAQFVSSGKLGDVQINAVSNGEVVGTATLHIQNPDSLKFTSDEVNLNYDDVSDLGLNATYLTEQVNLKDGDIDWTISDSDAGVISDNKFTVTSNKKYSGSPTVTASFNDLTASVTVNIGMQPTTILDGGDEDIWDYSTIGNTVTSFSGMNANEVATYHYAGRGGVVTGSVVSDTDPEYADIVRFGHNAIRLDYDWTGLTGTDGACLGLGKDLDIDGTPTAIGLWVYIPEGVPVPWLRAQIATSTDGGKKYTNAYINFSAGAASGEGLSSGWQYLEADLTQYAGSLIRINSGMLFRGMVTTGGIGWTTTDGVKLSKNELKGWLLIDNLSIVYGANNQDVTAPQVTSLSVINDDGTKTEIEDGMTIDSSSLSFYATYDDNETTDDFATGIESAYFYFDGIYKGVGTKDNLGSTLNVNLSAGEHSITFYLKDAYGNVTRDTRYFYINDDNAELANVSLKTDGNPEVGKDWNLYLVSDNISEITQISNTTLSISSTYPVTDVAFPDGINGTWSYNKGTLSISIPESNFSADDEYIAKITVNVPNQIDEGSAINVQVTKGQYGVKFMNNMDIDLVNGYMTTFSNQLKAYDVSATYRLSSENMVQGQSAFAVATFVENDTPAADLSVYDENNTLIGTTDENGNIDISSLAENVGTVNLYAKDASDNYSYKISIPCYTSTGTEDGSPYYILYNQVDDASTQKNISWMSSAASASKAQIKISADSDMNDALTYDGSSKKISYSRSNLINRSNSVYLTDLTPNTTYYYQVGDGEIWSDVKSFTTSKSNSLSSKFFLIADIQEESAIEGMTRISNLVKDSNYDFGVQLGDAVDNVRLYNEWEDTLNIFSIDGLADMNMVHVIGNHEADDDGNNASAAKSVFNIKDDWYSFESGDVYVAVLNYTSRPEKIQEFGEWLQEDAKNSNADWKILVSHVPVYYTNPTGGGETYLSILPEYIQNAGIDFCFAGNDHSYARTAPMTNGSVDEDNGTVYYICGSTGGKSYAVVNNPEFNFQVATLDFESVYLDVNANKNSFTVTAYNVNSDGSVSTLDTYTKQGVEICNDDEHSFIYDRDTKDFTCSVCGLVVDPMEEQYNGWVKDTQNNDMYFVAGEFVTGYQVLKSATANKTEAYLFDDNGLFYTGFGTDGTNIYYAIDGICQQGYVIIDGKEYYFNNSRPLYAMRYGEIKVTKANSNGLLNADTVIDFKYNGEIKADETGTLYLYYGDVKSTQSLGWISIDGDYYYIRGKGVVATGRYYVTNRTGAKDADGNVFENDYYNFDENGKLQIPNKIKNGFYNEDGVLYYYVDGIKTSLGWINIDGDYYYIRANGVVATGKYYVTNRTGAKDADGNVFANAYYNFDSNGKLQIPNKIKNGFYNEDGVLYYYVDGAKTSLGWINIDGDYYYIRANGVVAVGKYYVTNRTGAKNANGEVFANAYYNFDSTTGKLCVPEQPKNGIYKENDGLYYYKDNNKVAAGWITIAGDYYYIRANGVVATGKYYVTNRTGAKDADGNVFKNAYYYFADDGKLINQ